MYEMEEVPYYWDTVLNMHYLVFFFDPALEPEVQHENIHSEPRKMLII